MILSANVRVALANMLANKTRSMFSMLGIVIGTAAVILVISIVNGTRRVAIEQSMNGRENMLRIVSRYNENNGTIPQIDPLLIDRIREFPHVESAYPNIEQELQVRGSFGHGKTNIISVDDQFGTYYKLKMVMGRFFTAEEMETRPRICVISDALAETLFGLDFPLGQKIRTEKGAFHIVGIFKAEARLKRMEVQAGMMLPYRTAIQLTPDARIYQVQIRIRPGFTEEVKTALLEMQKDGRMPDEKFAIVDLRDYQREVEAWAKSWLIQMAMVSSISLFVGGIGLMNVMLTTVAERTHEIGLRKALGADSKAVLHQFLIESVVLSGAGGLMGIILGAVLAYSVDVMANGRIYASVLPISLLLSFAFSLITGILFGLFPASKAANLSPVEALRYE